MNSPRPFSEITVVCDNPTLLEFLIFITTNRRNWFDHVKNTLRMLVLYKILAFGKKVLELEIELNCSSNTLVGDNLFYLRRLSRNEPVNANLSNS